MHDVTLLSYGMGVESSAFLACWCFEPAVRPCPLNELTVITAQTGDEYADTGRDVEAYILPLMRSHSIRFVQVHLRGASDELRRDGTVPSMPASTGAR